MAKSPLAGFPDIAGLYKGHFIALEIKTKTGKLSEPQVNWMITLRENGAFAATVRSLDEAIEFLRQIDAATKEPIYSYARIPIINL